MQTVDAEKIEDVTATKEAWDCWIYNRLFDLEYVKKNALNDLVKAGMKRKEAIAYINEKIEKFTAELAFEMKKPIPKRRKRYELN